VSQCCRYASVSRSLLLLHVSSCRSLLTLIMFVGLRVCQCSRSLLLLNCSEKFSVSLDTDHSLVHVIVTKPSC
jgi:hypothetical protein